MSAKPFTVKSIVPSVPKQQTNIFSEQQLPDVRAFSSMKNWVLSGGLNPVSGTTRSKVLTKKTYITFFHWSIKGAPNNAPEIELYLTINGVVIQIIRHSMPLYPWGIGQAVANEEYQDRTYNFIPPLIIVPVTAQDTVSVSCDGSSDGNFCLIGYEDDTK